MAGALGWPARLGGRRAWVAGALGWPARLDGRRAWMAGALGWPARLDGRHACGGGYFAGESQVAPRLEVRGLVEFGGMAVPPFTAPWFP
jgi:hypothetical protein